jgi:hypothetical protein
MALYFEDLFIGPGDHASRPAVTDSPEGALYVCTDDNVVEVNDGATWSEWFDPHEVQP